jgi:hypothetical protein
MICCFQVFSNPNMVLNYHCFENLYHTNPALELQIKIENKNNPLGEKANESGTNYRDHPTGLFSDAQMIVATKCIKFSIKPYSLITKRRLQ